MTVYYSPGYKFNKFDNSVRIFHSNNSYRFLDTLPIIKRTISLGYFKINSTLYNGVV